MRRLLILTMLLFAMPVFATVSDGESIRQSFTTNGSTTTFTFTFKCNSSDDVFVYSPVILTGLPITPLVEDTDYTIAPTGGSYLNGGVVTIDPALAATVALRIVRRIKQSQETSSGAITPATIIAALDKLTRQVQDAEDRKKRSLHIPDSDSVAFDMTVPNAITRAGNILGFDDNGNITIVDSSGTFTSINAFWDDIITKNPWVDVRAFGAVGNGTADDTAAIQEAFDVSGAKIVYLPAGLTFLVSGLIITTDDCTIQGYGSTLKLKVLDALDGSPIIDNQSSNLKIYGLHFDGQKDSQPADGFSDSFNTGTNSTGRAYRAGVIMDRNATAGLSGLLIKDCFFEDIYGACIATNQISKVRILDCVAENNFFELGMLYDLPATGANEDAILAGNRIYDAKSGHATINANGFTVTNYSHLIVADNQIRDVDRNFIKVEGGNHITITGNVGENNDDSLTFSFIQFQGDSTNVVISNNMCKHFQRGIQFNIGDYSYIAITGNVLVDIVDSSTGDAIIADGTSFNDVIIANNIIGNVMRDGIHINNHNRLTIVNNSIYGHASNTVGKGIVLNLFSNAEDVVIRGNTIQNFSGGLNAPNIYIIRDASETLTNLLIQGNIIKCGSSSDYSLRITADMIINGIISDNYMDGIVETISSSINWSNNIITGTVTQALPALANDGTPSVASRSDVYLTGGTTTITDLDDGITGQKIIILAEHSLTITDGTNILLEGSQNFGMISGDSLTLICKADNKWYELSRTIDVSQTYSVTNVTTDRDYDADSTSTAELADILGTLIVDLRARGIIK